MSRWHALFDEYRAHEAERLEVERRAREVEAARRDFEAWGRTAVEQVISQLCTKIAQRSEELAIHAGVRIRIKPPRTAPGRHPRAEITFLELSRGQELVYVYAYHELGHAPLVHYLIPSYEGFLERARHPRLLSLPGARLERAADGSVVLARLAIDGGPLPEATTTIDDMVFRAFELLLRGRCVQRAARVALPPAEPALDAVTAVYGSPPARA
jgi:hypothetical protein